MAISDNYFDLWDLFRNHLFGDTKLFIAISIILILYYGLKNDMPYPVLLLVGMLWLSIIFEKTYIVLIWASLLMTAGFIYYFTINKILR